MKLTKYCIINQLQSELGFSKQKSIRVFKSLIELLKLTLESGEDVMVSGFGKFCVKGKKARKGRNPSTGEDIMLNPRRVVTFKPSGKLRAKVNEQ